MSFEQAAELSGYSVPQVRKIEGGHSPSVVCLTTLLDTYNVSLPEFFESAPRSVSKEDRQVFDELQFIIDEGRREDADDDKRERAGAIIKNVHEFYKNATRAADPRTHRIKKERPRSQKEKGGRFEVRDDAIDKLWPKEKQN